VLHPCGLRARPLARPAGVMTTTLCAKAHSRAATDRCEHYGRGERARCASLEQQGRIVPATGTAVVCPLPRRRVGCRVSPTPVERVVLVAVDTSQVVGLVHAWVGQMVTFFAYRPPSRPQGSLTPTVPSPGGSLTRLRATLGRLGKRLRQSAGCSGVSPSHRPSTGSCHRARTGSTAGPGQRLPPCMHPRGTRRQLWSTSPKRARDI
jgi:hypothetical protein